MREAGHFSAAMEILEEMIAYHRPALEGLKEWGKRHRFAGARDRSCIGHLVFDALRQRHSLAWLMGGSTPRHLIFGAYLQQEGHSLSSLEKLLREGPYGPSPLTEAEMQNFSEALRSSLSAAPEWVQADLPAWIWPEFLRFFGALEKKLGPSFGPIAQGKALAQRAPVDLRVNTLKTSLEKAQKSLAPFGVLRGSLAPLCLRIPVDGEKRDERVFRKASALQSSPAFCKGWVEIQDEGSQIAALMLDVRPGMQVLDFCAGGGGKTLALAAEMQNSGQIYAHDKDAHRLAPLYERARRAGLRNLQILSSDALEKKKILGRMDRVLVDAPCTGTGTWRRHPDAKWRLTPQALEKNKQLQRAALEEALPFLRPGGLLAYVTCSVLEEENAAQIQWLCQKYPKLHPVSCAAKWSAYRAASLLPSQQKEHLQHCLTEEGFLLLTPALSQTDGFFIALVQAL